MKTVSEWIAAGGLKSGYYLLERPISESRDKAVGVALQKYVGAGNPIRATAWFPKSWVKFVINDFYSDSIGKEVMLVPDWLMKKKEAEGFIL